ncbi:hypothetical protein OG730_00595 [Streptomyces sp. NBC_01298]|uniref:hypothetical protein n=1 Tax=Streptomyces sp. NBC_01298 TaxID=2903817 RepID=UPI002E15FEEF|nr:hypothetical protein OG730_00595 [Streptomyces sp. NBC_01298]
MHRLPRSLAQAGDPCDPQNHMHGLYPKLGHIRVYEHQHGRPLLSAPVVATATGRPGAGFAEHASQLGFEAAEDPGFWEHQVARAVRFWSADDRVMLMDSATDQVPRPRSHRRR